MKLTSIFAFAFLTYVTTASPASSSSWETEEDNEILAEDKQDLAEDKQGLAEEKQELVEDKHGLAEDKQILITKDLFPEEFVLHRAEHDIVSLVIPMNGLNLKKKNEDHGEGIPVIFYVQSDVKDDKKDYKGLYLHNRKTSKLILANGRDAAASTAKNNREAFFVADDGIYSYDEITESANKYGTFDKSSFAIAKLNGSDAIYVITDDKDLYKITHEGEDAKKIDTVEKPEAIVVDANNNLYFYSAGKAPQIFDGDIVKDISGLPSNPSYVALLRPAFILDHNCIPAVIDDKSYLLFSNGTSKLWHFEFEVHPTAYGMEASVIQYYAYDKKIYEYHVWDLIFGDSLRVLKNLVTQIRIKSKSRY